MLLNAVNLTFLTFARSFEGSSALDGHIAMLFVIALAASEACIGLALVIVLIRQRDVLDSAQLVDLADGAAAWVIFFGHEALFWLLLALFLGAFALGVLALASSRSAKGIDRKLAGMLALIGPVSAFTLSILFFNQLLGLST